MPLKSTRSLSTAIVVWMFCVMPSLEAVDWDGGGDNATWGCCTNWTGNSTPGTNTNVFFDCTVPSPNATVSLCCATQCIGKFVVDNAVCSVYTFQSGTIDARNGSGALAAQITNGTVTFNNGGKLCVTGNDNLFIGDCNGATATVNVSGACSSITVDGELHLGRCNNANATLNITNGATVTVDCNLIIGKCGSGTIILCGATLQTTGNNNQIKVGQCGEATIISTNSTIISTGDFDLGHNPCCESFLSMTGCAPVGCVYSSKLTVGRDLLVGHPTDGGDATANLHNTCVVVCGGFSVADHTGGSGYLTLSGQTKVTAYGDCSLGCARPSNIGGGGGSVAVVSINDCSQLILGVKGAQTSVKLKGGAIFDLGGGSVSATACDPAPIMMQCNSIIRGCGSISNDIILDSGKFGTGDAGGDVLLLTGNITQNNNNDEFTINASGTIRLGTNDMLDNTTNDMDIVLEGGTLDINGTNQGANGSELGTLTVSSNSTIEFTSGDSSQDVYLTGGGTLSATLTISGWDGVGGASGTGGRIIFNGRPFGWGDDDNSGAGFTGFNWGALGVRSELVDLGGGLFELVPFASAVPEPSTYFGGVMLVLFSYWHWRRRIM